MDAEKCSAVTPLVEPHIFEVERQASSKPSTCK